MKIGQLLEQHHVGFGFLLAGHGTKGFYQISIIMGNSSPGALSTLHQHLT